MLSFFPYFGAKTKVARHYPPPRHQRLIEPFAGSAGYATTHAYKDVVLIEKYPVIADIWRYLIQATPEQILRLPMVGPDQSIDEFDLPRAERHFIGFWLSFGSNRPKLTRTGWGKENANAWGERVRARIARQVPGIKHWTIIQGDYTDAPDDTATWFIDPPYALQGRHYVHGSDELNYPKLAKWCKSRQGQVMVCENLGADWLPFEPWVSFTSANKAEQQRKHNQEALWCSGFKKGFF